MLSTPVIIGMVVQALYNIVDTFFVARAYGAESVAAIGGLSIAFPVQMVIIGFRNFSWDRRCFHHLACPWNKGDQESRKGYWKCFYPESDLQHIYWRFMSPLP